MLNTPPTTVSALPNPAPRQLTTDACREELRELTNKTVQEYHGAYYRWERGLKVQDDGFSALFQRFRGFLFNPAWCRENMRVSTRVFRELSHCNIGRVSLTGQLPYRQTLRLQATDSTAAMLLPHEVLSLLLPQPMYLRLELASDASKLMEDQLKRTSVH